MLSNDHRQFSFHTGAATRGNARKTSGSYYTHDSLVQVQLESALEPVIASTLASHPVGQEAVDSLLSISVIDPACGSGHLGQSSDHLNDVAPHPHIPTTQTSTYTTTELLQHKQQSNNTTTTTQHFTTRKLQDIHLSNPTLPAKRKMDQERKNKTCLVVKMDILKIIEL
jgi:hypothetical protein